MASRIMTLVVKAIERTKLLRRKALRGRNSENEDIAARKARALNRLRAHHSSKALVSNAPQIAQKMFLVSKIRTKTLERTRERQQSLLKKISEGKRMKRRVSGVNKIAIEVVEQRSSDVAALLANLKDVVIGHEEQFLVNRNAEAGAEDRWEIKEPKIEVLETILSRFPAVETMRGSLGETVLHQCLVFMDENVPVLQALAHYFITRHPELINMIYLNKVFYGEVALHITVIKNQLVLFRTLIECGAKLNLRACGEFFLKFPQSQYQEELIASKLMPREVAMSIADAHCVYLGEFVLSFAGCTGNIEMVRILLKHGADIKAQDTLGNTVLHAVVNAAHKYKSVEQGARMFEFLHQKGADIRRLNCEGFTPLALCAYHGNSELFGHIIKCYQTLIWNYGPVRCYRSPLADLDPAADFIARMPRKSSRKVAPGNRFSIKQHYDAKGARVQSVLELAIGRRHLDLLRHPMLTRLVVDKWTAFGQRSFGMWMTWLVFHFIILLICSTSWPSQRMQNVALTRDLEGTLPVGWGLRADLSNPNDWHWVFHYGAGLIATFDAVALLALVVANMKLFGAMGSTTGTNALMVVHAIAILVAMSLFMFGITSAPRLPNGGMQTWSWSLFALDCSAVACSIALISGGLYLLSNMRGLPRLGALITMLSSIVKRDFSRFLPIYGILVLSYSIAFRVVYAGAVQMTPEYSYPNFMDLFSSSMGQEVDMNWKKAGPTLSQIYCKYVLFFSYSLFTTILAMNLLIGMLSDSFSKMWEISEKVSWLQRAIVVQHYERFDGAAWAKFVTDSPAYSNEEGGICITTQEEKVGWGKETKATKRNE